MKGGYFKDTRGSLFIGGYGGILWKNSLLTGLEVFLNVEHEFKGGFETESHSSAPFWSDLYILKGSMWLLGLHPTVKYVVLNKPFLLFIGWGAGIYYLNATAEEDNSFFASDAHYSWVIDTNFGTNFE